MFKSIQKNPKFLLLCGLILPELVIMVLMHFNISGGAVLVMQRWAETAALCSLAMLSFLFPIKIFLPVFIIYFLLKIMIQVWDMAADPAVQGLMYQIITTSGLSLINFAIMFLIFAVILQIVKFYLNSYVVAPTAILGLLVFRYLSVFFKLLLTLVPLGYTDILNFTNIYLIKNPGELLFPAGILIVFLIINYIFDMYKKSLQK